MCFSETAHTIQPTAEEHERDSAGDLKNITEHKIRKRNLSPNVVTFTAGNTAVIIMDMESTHAF